MADITICINYECNRNDCYRRLTEPSIKQSYSYFDVDNDGLCDHYWPVNSKSQIKRLNAQTKVSK